MLGAMRFGLAIPQYGFSLPAGQIGFADAIAWARRAERLGFDSVWLSDHLFYSFGRYGADPAPIAALEPLTTLAGIAATTDHVRLGVIVLAAGFRPAGLVAKSAATIDRVSGGRFELGLGAGWLEAEFEAFGYPFGSVGERFDVLERALAQVARSSSDPSAPAPRPLQDPFPVWVGGKGGPRLLRLAARHATGWNAVWRISPGTHERALADVSLACEREGRDPATFRRTVGLYGTVGATEEEARGGGGPRAPPAAAAAAGGGVARGAAPPPPRASFPGDAMREETWQTWRADTLSGSPEQVIERVGAFEALGVDELILSPWTLPFSVIEPEIVEVFAEEVIPRCR
jgi:alkanesulfonate monooxygenase SsuD/methylene tetrahydromethanopterin reductase-like flavin-dependent oxidoreductase (luciferase family)